MNYYIDVLKKYVDFNGRARRKEYWMFVLFNFIVYLILTVIGLILRVPFISTIYSLAVFLPGLAVTIRRLHDIGKSGVWFLIGFIPIVGPIWLIVLTCMDSTAGDNEFGPNPKEAIMG